MKEVVVGMMGSTQVVETSFLNITSSLLITLLWHVHLPSCVTLIICNMWLSVSLACQALLQAKLVSSGFLPFVLLAFVGMTIPLC